MAPLLPVVRRDTQPAQLARVAAGRPDLAPAQRSLAPWTRVLLVEDRRDRIRYVQHRDLAPADVDVAFDRAFAALAERAHEPVRVRDGVVEITDWGGYAASLVVLPAWRRVVADALGRDPVFLAPDADHLRVVDATHPALSAHLDWAFTTFRQAARPLSPAPLLAPERAPRNLALLKAFAYAEQDEVLLETAPDGVYIAETTLALTGRDATLSTRIEPGYPCWLPEVDLVDTPTGRVPLASLQLPAVPDVHPPRYRWPG
jgi:hypothetical protein